MQGWFIKSWKLGTWMYSVYWVHRVHHLREVSIEPSPLQCSFNLQCSLFVPLALNSSKLTRSAYDSGRLEEMALMTLWFERVLDESKENYEIEVKCATKRAQASFTKDMRMCQFISGDWGNLPWNAQVWSVVKLGKLDASQRFIGNLSLRIPNLDWYPISMGPTTLQNQQWCSQ